MTGTLVLEPEHHDLARSVRAYVRSAAPMERVRAVAETADARDPEFWRGLAEQIGVQGILVPDTYGGSASDLRTAGVIAEELGAALTPGPVLPALMATFALTVSRGWQRYLGGLAEGTLTAAVAFAGRAGDELTVTADSAGAVRVTGRIGLVQDGDTVDLLLMLTEVDGAPALVALERGEGWDSAAVPTVDVTRRFARLTLDDRPGTTLALTEAIAARIAAAADLLVSAEQLGLMRHSLGETVSYTKERIAFGRPVGSFQGVKHQLAELACLVAQAEALVRDAMSAAVDDPDEAPVAAAAALCFTGPAATRVASECLRLLGGIGYTWEHDAHLYFRRARVDERLLGAPVEHRRRLASLLGLGSAG